MKLWKHTLFSAAAFLTIAGSVLYTSCEKDPCTQLSCKNSGSCADGFCRCPTGYEGAECEIKSTSRFIGTYYGYTRCGEDPNLVDTLEVYQVAEPNLLEFFRRNTGGGANRGVPSGYRIVVDDDIEGNIAHYVNVIVDGKKITVFDEHVSDIANSTTNVCSFVGFRN